jgi:hypothetical protein
MGRCRGAFDPEDIEALITAQKMVFKRLNVVDRKSPRAFLVAKTIIQIAKDGERDPERLSENSDPNTSSRWQRTERMRPARLHQFASYVNALRAFIPYQTGFTHSRRDADHFVRSGSTSRA